MTTKISPSTEGAPEADGPWEHATPDVYRKFFAKDGPVPEWRRHFWCTKKMCRLLPCDIQAQHTGMPLDYFEQVCQTGGNANVNANAEDADEVGKAAQNLTLAQANPQAVQNQNAGEKSAVDIKQYLYQNVFLAFFTALVVAVSLVLSTITRGGGFIADLNWNNGAAPDAAKPNTLTPGSYTDIDPSDGKTVAKDWQSSWMRVGEPSYNANDNAWELWPVFFAWLWAVSSISGGTALLGIPSIQNWIQVVGRTLRIAGPDSAPGPTFGPREAGSSDAERGAGSPENSAGKILRQLTKLTDPPAYSHAQRQKIWFMMFIMGAFFGGIFGTMFFFIMPLFLSKNQWEVRREWKLGAAGRAAGLGQSGSRVPGAKAGDGSEYLDPETGSAVEQKDKFIVRASNHQFSSSMRFFASGPLIEFVLVTIFCFAKFYITPQKWETWGKAKSGRGVSKGLFWVALMWSVATAGAAGYFAVMAADLRYSSRLPLAVQILFKPAVVFGLRKFLLSLYHGVASRRGIYSRHVVGHGLTYWFIGLSLGLVKVLIGSQGWLAFVVFVLTQWTNVAMSLWCFSGRGSSQFEKKSRSFMLWNLPQLPPPRLVRRKGASNDGPNEGWQTAGGEQMSPPVLRGWLLIFERHVVSAVYMGFLLAYPIFYAGAHSSKTLNDIPGGVNDLDKAQYFQVRHSREVRDALCWRSMLDFFFPAGHLSFVWALLAWFNDLLTGFLIQKYIVKSLHRKRAVMAETHSKDEATGEQVEKDQGAFGVPTTLTYSRYFTSVWAYQSVFFASCNAVWCIYAMLGIAMGFASSGDWLPGTAESVEL